jgi:hypothetical protein
MALFSTDNFSILIDPCRLLSDASSSEGIPHVRGDEYVAADDKRGTTRDAIRSQHERRKAACVEGRVYKPFRHHKRPCFPSTPYPLPLFLLPSPVYYVRHTSGEKKSQSVKVGRRDETVRYRGYLSRCPQVFFSLKGI